MTASKSDIPAGERHEPSETTLDLPDLPGQWEWITSSHITMTHKIVVHFGLDENEPGGWLGEIDNWVNSDGDELWTVHTRPIVDDGTETGRPRETAEVSVENDSLTEAIESVPAHIATNFPTE